MDGMDKVFKGEATFFIAEIGINHNGSRDEALSMVEAAAGAGADAVKFQTFVPDEMYSRYTNSMLRGDAKPVADSAQIDFFSRFVLGEEDYSALKRAAESLSLVFFSSAFDIQSVEMLERVGIPIYKLASSEVTNTPLLRRIAATGKPVIMSTGMSTGEEIGSAVETLRSGGAGGLILLHCVSLYPLPPARANLMRIESLKKRFDLPVGFSDHAPDGKGCVLAAMFGARVFEKHFMPEDGYDCPDAAVSLSPGEFERMRRDVETAIEMIGDGHIDYDFSEKEVANSARRSLFSRRSLRAGEVLDGSVIAAKRPGVGLPVADMQRVLGRKIRRDIPEDFPLRLEDFE